MGDSKMKGKNVFPPDWLEQASFSHDPSFQGE